MTTITLTTDFGHRDYSVAIIKSALHQQIKDVLVVDITHQISPFDHSQVAYILGNAYKSFPKGSIHIVGVDAEFTPENIHLAMSIDGHYFIGADNGVFSLISKDIQPEKVVAINIHNNIVKTSSELDVFVKVAAHIARKGLLEVIGNPYNSMKRLTDVNPVVNDAKGQIVGSVIYIDNYGNVISNITEQLFKSFGRSRSFTIFARSEKFNTIYHSYSEVIDFSLPAEKRVNYGISFALFNSAGHMEIAIYKSNPETVGSASSLLGLSYRDTITVKFDL